MTLIFWTRACITDGYARHRKDTDVFGFDLIIVVVVMMVKRHSETTVTHIGRTSANSPVFLLARYRLGGEGASGILISYFPRFAFVSLRCFACRFERAEWYDPTHSCLDSRCPTTTSSERIFGAEIVNVFWDLSVEKTGQSRERWARPWKRNSQK